eukprot:scaffold3068_cov269-Pinguiococcus_pyrenoidosus.AAC.16
MDGGWRMMEDGGGGGISAISHRRARFHAPSASVGWVACFPRRLASPSPVSVPFAFVQGASPARLLLAALASCLASYVNGAVQGRTCHSDVSETCPSDTSCTGIDAYPSGQLS